MSILSIRLCKKCKRRLEKNPCISGDYDEEGRLLSFCPICGEGHPALSTGLVVFISYRKLKTLSSRIASIYGLPFTYTDNLAEMMKGVPKLEACKYYRNEIYQDYQIELSPEIFLGI